MNSTAEVLKSTEHFFSNTENDPMNPRLMLSRKLIGLGYGFRIDPVARHSEIYGDGSIMPNHVAVYEAGSAHSIWSKVAEDPEFKVLSRAYDSINYFNSAPRMDHCDWPDEMKKKVAAWAMKNTAVRSKTMAVNVYTNPWHRDASEEERKRVKERYTQEAEEAMRESQQVLGALAPLTVDELDYLVEKSIRQRLMPSI